MPSVIRSLLAGAAVAAMSLGAGASEDTPELTGLKAEAVALAGGHAKLTQEIVDTLFSYSELAFQEFETKAYLSALLTREGFTVEAGTSGMPSAWMARWTSPAGAGPVIGLGTDVDGIPKSSQKPGIAWREPLVEGAPGHGEGHNSGQGVNIAAALAVKELMIRNNIPGTLVIWPGVAEELVGAKAYFARDGLFQDMDAVIFTHVGNNLATAWGQPDRSSGLVSVEYRFAGVAAHGAGDPWKGKSALDAVELMNAGWNFRREHLRPTQRSHYVIVDGGDQPNVVPSAATVWYFIREIDAKNIRKNFGFLHNMAEGAALMTDTSFERRIVGSAWPMHFNKPIAERMYANIQAVGLPSWSEDDQAFAKALQTLMEADEIEGLATELEELRTPPEEEVRKSGGSDDIGDVSWSVPTVHLRFPANVKGLQGHHWSSAMTMATPIAHKGSTAGAKVVAATMVDLLTDADLRAAARAYFTDVQLKDVTYQPFISDTDTPAIEKNTEIMARFKPALEPFYYDASRYGTYLEQLGIDYPTLKKPE